MEGSAAQMKIPDACCMRWGRSSPWAFELEVSEALGDQRATDLLAGRDALTSDMQGRV
jgi:hypothetical protein